MKEAVDLLRQHRVNVAGENPKDEDLPGIDKMISFGEVWALQLEEREIFKSLEIGGKSAEQLEIDLKAAGVNIGDYSRNLLTRITTLPIPQRLDLVRRTGSDLGFSGPANMAQILKRGKERGYDPVPSETAAYLRLAYPKQPFFEILTMAMEPITDSYDRPRVFGLGHGVHGLWFRSHLARPRDKWDPEAGFVFNRLQTKAA